MVSKAPSRRGSAPSQHRGRDAAGLVVAVVFAFPILYLAWGTLRLGSALGGTLASSDTIVPLANSLLIASTTAAATAVVGTSLAWLVARTDLPARRLWQVLLPLPLVIPSFVGATAMLAAFGPGGLLPFVPRIEGFWGALLVLTLLTYPYVYLPVVARLRTTDPGLEDASRILGASPIRTTVRVVLPQVRPTIGAGTLLVFLYVLSDFGAVALMRFDTITRAIFSARLFDRPTSLTLGFLLAVLAVTIVAGERATSPRRNVAGTAAGTSPRYGLGRMRGPATIGAAFVLGSALLAPIAVFVTWVVRGSTTVGVGYSGITDSLAFLVEPVINSALAAAVAAMIGVVVVLPVAYLAATRRSAAAAAAAATVSAVFALPGLAVALALVFWAVRAPGVLGNLYQTFPLLIIAYVIHFGAQSMRASRAAIADIPKPYSEAAKTLGAGPARRFFSIDLPLIKPALLAGGGLILLSTLKELPATLLLAPTGFQTLATRIWGAAQDGFYAEVGITSLVLIVLSGALTWLVVLKSTNPEVLSTE